MFAAETYTARRARLRKQVGDGVILFLGNDESPMNYRDNTYPFRQDSTFLYYWGLNRPGLAATLDLDSDREVLYGAEATLNDVIWMGPQDSLAEAGARAGIKTVRPPEQLDAGIREARRQGRRLHVFPPYRAAATLRLARLLDVAIDDVPGLASEALLDAVIAQRSIKSEEEVAEIEAAVATSRAMHLTAMHRTRPGVVEQKVVGAIEGMVAARGTTTAYPTIFSIRGEVLHNHRHHLRMEAGHLVVNDSGAASPLSYASDITRTLPVSGRFSTQQRELYDLVLAAQRSALDAIRPGVPYRDVHLLAARRLVEGLNALGLMRGDIDEAVQAGAHALFMPTGLGHMLGLDVHDMEDLGEDRVGYGEGYARSDQFGLRNLRLARPLRRGFVLTVEPGIYFIPPLIDLWHADQRNAAFIAYERLNAYRDFGGVRVEDNVLVEAEGARVLGPPIPRTADEVEAEMGKGDARA